jgi:membrane-associated protease RseP (regulator of RpoE activity)
VGDAISHVNGCNLSSLNGSRDASMLLQDLWSELDPADPDHAEISLSLVEATRDAILVSRPPVELGLSLAPIHHTKTVGEFEYALAKFGVLVTSVARGSPAAAAGLEAGDVVYSANGRIATDPTLLLRELNERRAESGVASVVVSQHPRPATATALRNALRADFGYYPVDCVAVE